MSDKISPANMSALSTTLLIPLWAKAVEYQRPDALLRDAEAARMLFLIDFDFDKFKSAKMSQPGCCGRAALIDEEAKDFIKRHPDGVIIQLGAGLDARFERLGRPRITAWYDLDLPDVIALRRRLLPESENHYLSMSMFDETWMEKLSRHAKPILILLEGVAMYFEEREIKSLLNAVHRHFPQATLVLDIMPPIGVGKSKRHDVLKNIRETPPEFKWGLNKPKLMESWLPGLSVKKISYLSKICYARYPWWGRLLYRTSWGRRHFDHLVVTLDIMQRSLSQEAAG